MQNFRKKIISKTPKTPKEVITKGYAKKLIEKYIQQLNNN